MSKNDIDTKAFWSRLDVLLSQKGMTMFALNKACNLSGSYLFVIKCRGGIPSMSVCNRIADTLDVSIDYLLNGDKNMAKGENLIENIILAKMRSDPEFKRACITLSENSTLVRLINGTTH